MNFTTPNFTRIAAYSLAVVLTGMAPLLQADQDKPRSPDCPGMVGGYGIGPGMMGGYGMGPGMMGGYGMGSGMAPGMTGGYGMTPAMMGGYWGIKLDLTDEQQATLNRIQDETRKSHWAMMNEMMNQQARLRDLHLAPKQDRTAIDATYKAFGKLQQQMYESAVAAHRRMEAVLTKEQHEKLRTHWRKGWTPDK